MKDTNDKQAGTLPSAEPVPAVLSYITIFNCPKYVPNFCEDSPEVQ